MTRQLPSRAWVMIILLVVAGSVFIGLFAWQTWEFVNWLLPTESWLMKDLAVLNFDVMSLVWLLCDLFVPLSWNSKVVATIAGGIDFILSIVATLLQLTVVAAVRFATNIPAPVIYSSYGIIALALVINIVGLILLLRIEWPRIIGEQNVFATPDSSTNKPNKRMFTESEVHRLFADFIRQNSGAISQVSEADTVEEVHPLVAGARRIKSLKPPKKIALAQEDEKTGTK